MPLQMASELRFPMGASTPLSSAAVDDFLVLVRRITSTSGQKQILETFRKYFCRASGKSYWRSSSLSYAESDLSYDAYEASSDAPSFIAAFCDACEYLGNMDITVPNQINVNNILQKHNVLFRIINNKLCTETEYLTPPEPETSPASIVSRALSDAKALIGNANASSAIDRAHTALQGYLVQLCMNKNIDIERDTTTAKAFKLLRQRHPALKPEGPRATDVTRVLQAFSTSIDAFSTIRNKASLAHANELLDEPEATAVVNAIYTIFRYIQDCIQRYEHQTS